MPHAPWLELLTIVGGGHTWPGGSQYLPKFVIGPVTRDFSASERAWQFFVDHARR
jgi:polyhydroxybutyrate depolymerase